MTRGRSRKAGLALLAVTAFLFLYLGRRIGNSAGDISVDDSLSKHVVVAATSQDDTSWVHEHLPGWTSSIYVVDDDTAELTVPITRGGEAMVYISYLINNYQALPDVMVFMHGQDQHESHDLDQSNSAIASRLSVSHIVSRGFVSLKCRWSRSCPSGVRVETNHHENILNRALAESLPQLLPKRKLPLEIGSTGGSQFALSKDKALQLSLKDYRKLRHWMVETWMEDSLIPRVMELSWHVIFGQPVIDCPDAGECYCQLYGLCGFKGCSSGSCSETVSVGTLRRKRRGGYKPKTLDGQGDELR